MLTVTPARRRLVVATFLVCASAMARASAPKFFQAATQADFLKGEVENLSIDGHGQLVLGPATELVYETPAPFLWTVTPAPDGSIFIGTGNDGRVFRVDAQGKGAPFFDAAELEVHAMAPAPKWRAVRGDVARRQDLQSRQERRGRARFSIRRRNTSGRSPSTARATCTPAPAKKASSTRSRLTARARRSIRQRRRMRPR